MVQIREKDLSARALHELGIRLGAGIAGRSRLIVNDRVDVALALGADGVQLPEDGIPVTVARRLVGPEMLIGRSVHSVRAAVEAEEVGADFLIAGTVFPSATHPESPVRGIGFLSTLRQEVSIPILAIGGVTRRNVREVMETGIAGVAVVSAISEAEDPGAATRSMVHTMGSSTI